MSEHRETFVIEETLLNERLDVWLSSKYPEVSRGTIVRLIKDGEIRVNDQQVKPNHRPRVGESVSVHFPPPKTPNVKAVEIPLEILYEDGDLLVINKQPGLVVHAASGEEEDTLVNALLHHCDGQLSGIAGVARPGIVHRLDKDTSGLMVVGKTLEAVTALSRAIAAREVSRQYLALAHGTVDEAFSVMSSIGRDPVTRVKMAVVPAGKAARTDVQRLLCGPWQDPASDLPPRAYSGVLCTLHTGRTHQIRVHLSSRKHPLVADALYGGTLALGMRRQALHAAKLSFKHPITGEALAFEAPLPDDMAQAWAALASAATADSQSGV